MNNKTEGISKQLENDDFDDETKDQEIVIEILEFSTIA